MMLPLFFMVFGATGSKDICISNPQSKSVGLEFTRLPEESRLPHPYGLRGVWKAKNGNVSKGLKQNFPGLWKFSGDVVFHILGLTMLGLFGDKFLYILGFSWANPRFGGVKDDETI